MEIDYNKTCKITEELPSGYTLEITVDQLCDEGDSPFELAIGGNEFGWVDCKDLNAIKKTVMKAMNIHKAK
jgi:hypothetical protein